MDDQIYLRGLTNVIFDELNIDLTIYLRYANAMASIL